MSRVGEEWENVNGESTPLNQQQLLQHGQRAGEITGNPKRNLLTFPVRRLGFRYHGKSFWLPHLFPS